MTEWHRTTIAEIASKKPHALATGPFGSAISAKNFVNEGVPVIRGSNLSLDVSIRLRDGGLAFLTKAKADEFKRSVARKGDLVFTCWGTIGQIGLIDDRAAYSEYVVSNKQMKVTPDPAKADSTFLYYLLSSPEMVRAVTGQAIGAAVPGFNLGQLRDIAILMPPLDVQVRIAGVLNSIDNLIENNRRRVAVLEEMAR
ncbi:MAG TPA: restriction endonuclease subunit S, partial [Planctomycetota bacterium]|nr:restriction endonuclease subunit S [Planctomycetota bacterium]